MLRQEVIDAVREGKFHVYAVDSIDEGIEVLTGVEAGERRDDGSYPEGSVNYRVDKQLREMATKLKQFDSRARRDGGHKGRKRGRRPDPSDDFSPQARVSKEGARTVFLRRRISSFT